jgi:hypothetical protein
MNARYISVLIAATLFLAVIQFVAALAGAAAGLVAGLLVGLAAIPLLSLVDAEPVSYWIAPVAAFAASCTGVAIRLVASAPEELQLLLLAPLVAGGAAAAVRTFREAASRKCRLCNQRLGRAITFVCPRCGLEVCESRCWEFDGLRCRLCAQNEVPLFPAEEAWWRQMFGNRLNRGRCQLCKDESLSADLRACPQCGRPQCRRCWDQANGQCQHCRWTAPDLPPELSQLMTTGPAATRYPKTL